MTTETNKGTPQPSKSILLVLSSTLVPVTSSSINSLSKSISLGKPFYKNY